MPTYEFICEDDQCKYEWEEILSIVAPNPEVCPKCNKSSVKKLISLGGRGVVILEGQDLVDKTKEDVRKLKQEMHSSEKVYSNMLGEDRHQQMQQRIDRQKRK